VTIVWLLAGLVALVAGAELLVRGASSLARAFGIPSLLIGLTVVAFGTSTPELVVSVVAALEGRPSIAVGNVVGSNIFNVLFILGLCTLIRPLVVASDLVRRDVPVMIGVSLLLWLFALDGRLGLGEAVVCLGGLVGFGVFTIGESRAAATPDALAAKLAKPRWLVDGAAIAVGLLLLVVGARWLVAAAVTVAQGLGVSESVIGLTIVAAGTSLPEVAASVVATLRGERDIAVGNVVGSNIFNILGILGITGILAGGRLPIDPGIVAFDLPVMAAVALACLPIFASGHRLDRWEGGLFLAYYVAYTTYLILASTGHDALPALSLVMAEFALPLTAVTLAVVAWRIARPPGSSRAGTAEGRR
jgi:cation:H+ antiporter